MPIHILRTDVASQIAAGEVVERPVSVVKELLENSLDAEASHVTIKCFGSGQKSIEIADDGIGIPEDSLVLALQRHATSKVEKIEDLERIQTLGFRGEALASISSVSRFTISSRTREMDHPYRIKVDGGISGSLTPVSGPIGTVIRVEDLFFNVPARRKFLKHENTERRLIDDLVQKYALAFPYTRFSLEQEGKSNIQTTGSGNRREVLSGVYGIETARQLLEVIFEDNGIRITGYISPPSVSRSNRKEIVFFVNSRPVQDQALASAVIQAYQTLIMVGRYPMTWLFIELDPGLVDVNVHPSKAEVRFANPGWMFSNVQRAVRLALIAHNPVPNLDLKSTWQPLGTDNYTDRFSGQYLDNQLSEISVNPRALGLDAGIIQHPLLNSKRLSLLRLIGQIASTYLVAEGPDGLYLIDQHAAHERVLFEKFFQQPTQEIHTQSLLEPVVVTLSPSQADILENQIPILASLGFLVENFGSGSFLVRGIPGIFTGMDASAALRVLVDEFEEDEKPLQGELTRQIIARICKRAAVKAGKSLSVEEQKALLQDLERCESPRTCPHGRPTMIHLPVELLERQFGRRGSI